MNNVSVIVVSWNARELLRACLKSVFETSAAILQEVIVVDNDSRDGSAEMVADCFPQVILLRNQCNEGFARANNRGISSAKGRWLAFINSDVVVHEGCMRELVAYLESNPNAGLAGPLVFDRCGELQNTCRRFPTVLNTLVSALCLDRLLSSLGIFIGRETKVENFGCPVRVEVISGCFWMANRAAVAQVGPLDPSFFFYAEDVDWCKRHSDLGWEVVWLPTACATHYGGGSSLNEPLRYSVEMIRANLTYWRKYRGLAGQIAYYLMSIVHHSIRIAIRGGGALILASVNPESIYKLKRSLFCLGWLLTSRHDSRS